MKKQTVLSLSIIGLTVLLSSCNRIVDDVKGNVRLSLNNDWEVSDISKSNVSDFTTLPESSMFKLSVTDAEGNSTEVSEPGKPLSLVSGNYTAKASYGSTSEEGFDKPCFEGSQNFTVIGGEDKEETITVKLANCIVKIETGAQFRNYYSDWNFTVESGSGTKVDFGKGETRAAFFDAYLIKISGTLTGQNGKSYVFNSKEYKNLEAATCYTIRFDLTNVGGSSISISFNDEVEEVGLGTIDIND